MVELFFSAYIFKVVKMLEHAHHYLLYSILFAIYLSLYIYNCNIMYGAH